MRSTAIRTNILDLLEMIAQGKGLPGTVIGFLNDEANELRDRLVDELYEEIAEDWGPIIDEPRLAEFLADEWKSALEHGLPETLAHWLSDLLFSVVSPEAVAHLIAARAFEANCIEVEFDPTPEREAA